MGGRVAPVSEPMSQHGVDGEGGRAASGYSARHQWAVAVAAAVGLAAARMFLGASTSGAGSSPLEWALHFLVVGPIVGLLYYFVLAATVEKMRRSRAAFDSDSDYKFGLFERGAGRIAGEAVLLTRAGEEVTARAMGRMEQIGQLLDAIDAGSMTRGGGGADIGPLMREGVPGIGHKTVGEHYMDWHHTHADTIDKVDPRHFREAVAALAVMSFGLADASDRLAAV